MQSEPSLPRPRKQLFTAAQAHTGFSAARANFLRSMMVAANATGVLATFEEMYDFGIVEQGE
eukprot:4408841-Prymnesium_polylepis.1